MAFVLSLFVPYLFCSRPWETCARDCDISGIFSSSHTFVVSAKDIHFMSFYAICNDFVFDSLFPWWVVSRIHIRQRYVSVALDYRYFCGIYSKINLTLPISLHSLKKCVCVIIHARPSVTDNFFRSIRCATWEKGPYAKWNQRGQYQPEQSLLSLYRTLGYCRIYQGIANALFMHSLIKTFAVCLWH